MKFLSMLLLTGVLCTATRLSAQDTFAITGTYIPTDLLKLNYGPLPRGIEGFDLNICNLTDARHQLTSSEVYQALSQNKSNLRPIGRQIMLAAILRNQNHSLKTSLTLGLNSTTSVLSVIGNGRQSSLLSSIALATLVGQQVLSTWTPVLTADQVEKFEAQVLEPAMVLDGGSCVERTVFTVAVTPAKKAARQPLPNLEFHVR